jgi:hypothetical protein
LTLGLTFMAFLCVLQLVSWTGLRLLLWPPSVYL